MCSSTNTLNILSTGFALLLLGFLAILTAAVHLFYPSLFLCIFCITCFGESSPIGTGLTLSGGPNKLVNIRCYQMYDNLLL